MTARAHYTLPAAHTLLVVAIEALVIAEQLQDATIRAVINGGASHTFGPYLLDRDFIVHGQAAVAIAEGGSAFAGIDSVAVNAGAPVDAVRATLSRNPAGDDNALTFTAVAYGAGGNAITIGYADPAADDAALSIEVVGNAITANLATDSEGAITSTAAEVLAAIEAHSGASALVTVAIDATDTGVADDGSGVVTALAAAPMTGGVGTSVGVSVPGGILIDTTNANVYRNDGTQAAPVFIQLGDAA